jgi:hypothetical protein
MAYAMDFEKSYEDDEWARCEQHFADDAIYTIEGLSVFECTLKGPSAITKGMQKSVAGLDRKLDSRTVEITSEITETGDRLNADWLATYTYGDAPPLKLVGHSHVEVADDKIVLLVDSYTTEMDKEAIRWVSTYFPELDGSYV